MNIIFSKIIAQMLKTNSLFFIITTLVLLLSCKNDNVGSVPKLPNESNYLHLSHTRTDSNPKMDSIAELIDFSKYDMLWLGGDLANLTSKDDETMMHADSIYSLGDLNTLWTLGNHDYTDVDKVIKYTNRPLYYACHKNGITFIVLDTQDSLSSVLDGQLELFNNVMDTIKESSHLIILHHKLIWMYGNPELEPQIPSISNVGIGDCSYCINPNNFYPDLYPELVRVHNLGIDVICIGGDMGIFAKEFEYQTKDGIHFLASGIYTGETGNKALVFHHDLVNKTLNWKYKLLVDLQ